jgi:hypothetical protein
MCSLKCYAFISSFNVDTNMPPAPKKIQQHNIYHAASKQLLLITFLQYSLILKSKAIPVSGGLQSCEMLRIPHYIDIWLTDGGEVVSPTHWSHFTPKKYESSASGTHFLLQAE